MVLPRRDGRRPHETLAALERQSRPPDERVVLGSGRALPRAMATVLSGRADWLWLLDGNVQPNGRALDELLKGLERARQIAAPVLLASKVAAADGRSDRGSLPVPQAFDHELVVSAAERRLLPLRVARRGSLLVAREDLEHFGPPRGGRAPLADDIHWTARLLRGRAGFLVPGSVVAREPDPGRPGSFELAAAAAARLRLLLDGTLERRELPWFGFRLAEEALKAARARSGQRS